MLHLLQDLLVEFPGTTPESVDYKPLLQYIMLDLVSDGIDEFGHLTWGGNGDR